MTTLPYPALPAATESAAETFRFSAAFPLPRLRPVADFVALPSTRRDVSVQGALALAAAASTLAPLVAEGACALPQ